jgi:hypothetical protein
LVASNFLQPENIKDVQIMNETTRGTFAAPNAATNATFIGRSPQIAFSDDMGTMLSEALGARDPAAAYSTQALVNFRLALPEIQNPTGLDFLQRGINLADGIADTFSGCLRVKLSGTWYYLKLKNMVLGSGILGVVGKGPWVAPTLILDGILEAFNNAAPTNWTFVDPPQSSCLTGEDGGATPVTIYDTDASSNFTPSVRSVAYGFNNFDFPIPQIGTTPLADIIPTKRGITIGYVVNSKDLSAWLVHSADHSVNSTILMLSGANPISLTGVGGRLDPWSAAYGMMAPGTESYRHTALSGSLSID